MCCLILWILRTFVSNMTLSERCSGQTIEIQLASIPFELKFSCSLPRLIDRLFLLKVPIIDLIQSPLQFLATLTLVQSLRPPNFSAIRNPLLCLSHLKSAQSLFQKFCYLACILLVHFLPLLVVKDFAEIENVFFWASLEKTADFEGFKTCLKSW